MTVRMLLPPYGHHLIGLSYGDAELVPSKNFSLGPSVPSCLQGLMALMETIRLGRCVQSTNTSSMWNTLVGKNLSYSPVCQSYYWTHELSFIIKRFVFYKLLLTFLLTKTGLTLCYWISCRTLWGTHKDLTTCSGGDVAAAGSYLLSYTSPE